jgi:hypothetical protein
LFGEEVKETLFARQEPLQKSWHGDSPLKSLWRSLGKISEGGDGGKEGDLLPSGQEVTSG